jgi:hypothetical protein
LEALLSYINALEAYALELDTAIAKAHPDEVNGHVDMNAYIEGRKARERKAIGELVGPLLHGASNALFHSFAVFLNLVNIQLFDPESS